MKANVHFYHISLISSKNEKCLTFWRRNYFFIF